MMLTTLTTVIKPWADKIEGRRARVVRVADATPTTRTALMAASRGQRH